MRWQCFMSSLAKTFIGVIRPLFIAPNIYQRHKSLHFYGFLWPLPLSLCRQSVLPPLLVQKKSLEYIIKKYHLYWLYNSHMCLPVVSLHVMTTVTSLVLPNEQRYSLSFWHSYYWVSHWRFGNVFHVIHHKMSAGINFIFPNSFEL